MKYSKFTYSFMIFKYTILAIALTMISCDAKINHKNKTTAKAEKVSDSLVASRKVIQSKNALENQPTPAADNIQQWIALFKGRNVAVVSNQTSVVRSSVKNNKTNWDEPEVVTYTHLVDTLLSRGVLVKKVFAPEHGFRGTADAGASIKDGIDSKTGLPIISLYGSNKKPTEEQLADVDIVIFDIQDVGARFYTYISTLHYVMEACSRLDKKVVVLDRPNPNGHYIDGPILEPAHKSFVGMHPVPVVHGMTIGEYAQMINGERWLEYGLKCDLMVLKMNNYRRTDYYSLPIKPSPNLPNDQAINLYPSLCFFEGTDISVGRGTEMQFQVYGSPVLAKYRDFSFTPTPNEGAKRPLHNGKKCFGVDLRSYPKLDQINLDFLIDAYAKAPSKKNFFNSFFTNLAGTENLQKQIEAGMTASEIRASWENDLKAYDVMRQPYLLY
ncbi:MULTISPECIES: exo-beta-N-acetylmuramidase NamZ domain-containing protein [Nonlabens]